MSPIEGYDLKMEDMPRIVVITNSGCELFAGEQSDQLAPGWMDWMRNQLPLP